MLHNEYRTRAHNIYYRKSDGAGIVNSFACTYKLVSAWNVFFFLHEILIVYMQTISIL
jgi:hypothetical protein